jgi:hypothetical protein
MNKFYDSWESERLIAMGDDYPYQALSLMEQYIERYPKDYYMRIKHISVLIDLGYFDKAQELIEDLEYRVNNDTDYLFLEGFMKRKLFEWTFYLCKMRLAVFKDNDIEKAREIFNTKWKESQYDDEQFKTFQLYCETHLDHQKYPQEYFHGYLFNQVANYSDLDFRYHIEKHLSNYLRTENTNVFAPDFPVDEVIEEIKKILPCDTRNYYGIIQNRYIFKYDGCGRDKEVVSDYFMVIAFHNTLEFITMFPFRNQQGYPAIDLNYLKKEPVIETKPMSQIDKFNRRLTKMKH